jgi:thioredoxin reductase (NADPH)
VEDPVVLIVESVPAARRALERVLGRRFGGDYRVLTAESPSAALELLTELAEAQRPVALVMADLWLPGSTGIALLARVRELHPRASRVLLFNYGDQKIKEPLQQALGLGYVQYYLPKDWEFPEQWLYPSVSEFLSAWSKASRPGFEAVRIVGEQWTRRCHDLRDVLAANGIPYGFYAVNSEEGRTLLRRHGVDDKKLPVVVLYDGSVFVDPSDIQIAEALGAGTRPDRDEYDLVIVGGGPAGLAAAVYAASEGLATAVIERKAVGGQAGASSNIRNYLGFPRGVTGNDLAVRAYEQAWLFGADFVFLRNAKGLRPDRDQRVVRLSGNQEIRGRAVLVATGIAYRRLASPALEALSGAGVYYGATAGEARAMEGLKVFVAGGGNSAGQAALHLARYAASVELLCRGESLYSSMSGYLITEIQAAQNVVVRPNTEVVDGHGTRKLEALTLLDTRSGQMRTVEAAALFVLIGAEPYTDWLAETVLRDEAGYILTGRDLPRQGGGCWPLGRAPLSLETSLPGVFAAGDVRHGSVKRVASAVGEGAVAVQELHEYLSQS